jgi:multidrug resistance efflux pump
MQLRRRPRFDTLQNEIRERRGRSWGRWIYLGLLAAFAVWVFNLFFGDLVYFQAEGLVMRDRVVLATQYPAKVDELDVQEGSEIKQNQLLARVRSQSVEESLAKLYAGLVDGLDRMTQLKVRDRVIEATAPMTEQRWREAHDARRASDQMRNQQLLTIGRRAELVKDEIESAQGRIQAEAEAAAISENLPQLESALEADKTAVARLRETYADGLVQAPVTGVVGYLHVSKGSVVQPGEPLMEIFTGQPYVLAYVPEGALYDLQQGDKVNIGVGLSTYEGHVARLYAVAGQLPKEFQNTFQPVARARIVRIEFDSDGHYPALFTKTKLSAAGWPPAWMTRLLGSYLFSLKANNETSSTQPPNDANRDSAPDAVPPRQTAQ